MPHKFSCFRLFRHWICFALSFTLARAGRSMAARMAMMAITTRSSINVNAGWRRRITGERKVSLDVWLVIILTLLLLCIGRDDKATPANEFKTQLLITVVGRDKTAASQPPNSYRA